MEILTAIFAFLSTSGLITAVVKLFTASAARAEAKAAAEAEHNEQLELLREIRAGQKARESKELRELRKKVKELERELAALAEGNSNAHFAKCIG